jgi:hypothetical protein
MADETKTISDEEGLKWFARKMKWVGENWKLIAFLLAATGIGNQLTVLTGTKASVTALDSIQAQNARQSVRSLKLDRLISLIEDSAIGIRPKIDSLYVTRGKLNDMLASTGSGQRMLHEYDHVKKNREKQKAIEDSYKKLLGDHALNENPPVSYNHKGSLAFNAANRVQDSIDRANYIPHWGTP